MNTPEMAPKSLDRTVSGAFRFFGSASPTAKGAALFALISFLGIAGILWIGKDAWVEVQKNSAKVDLLVEKEEHCQHRLQEVESASRLRDASQELKINSLQKRVEELEAKETAMR